MPRKSSLGIVLLLALLALPFPARAQFLGNVNLQTTAQTFALNCGALQPVQNLGQNFHTASYSITSGTSKTYAITLEGSNDGTHFNTISTVGRTLPSGLITGVHYYSLVRVDFLCDTAGAAAGTASVQYSGSQADPFTLLGGNLDSAMHQQLWTLQAANANASLLFGSPFGSTSGTIYFAYNVATVAGSTITVSYTDSNGISVPVETFTVANTLAQQVFVVPHVPAAGNNFTLTGSQVTVTYTSGGATAGTFNLLYEFSPPSYPLDGKQYTHIAGTSATAVKGTSGFLHTLSINLGAAGTVSIFDLPSASCTGTPATNQIAIITATATTLQTFTYDVNLLTGICVKASVAMDLTVSSQ